jgi:hypothetical protein
MGRKEEETSFLKKRSNKLLLIAGRGDGGATVRINQNFFASFFRKKSSCFLLEPA